MYQNTFIHGMEKNSISSYFITRIDEIVLIKFSTVFFIPKNENKSCIFPLNVNTIPAFNKALLGVFKSGNGDKYYEDLVENGDKISIHMDSIPHSAKMTIINRKDLFNMEIFDILLDDSGSDPDSRVPTPELNWLTDSLQNLYNEWIDKVVFLETDLQLKMK